MNTDAKIVLSALLQFFLYSLAAASAVGLIILDVVVFGNNINEISFVEFSQELALLIVAVLFFRQAIKTPQSRELHVLIAGFFACMLIREMDAFLDEISHGFWFYPAITIAIIAVVFAIRKPRQVLSQMAEFVCHPIYGFMLSGLICILVFSRLFGMKIIWLSLQGDEPLRAVKNVVEEGTEFFGYALCLIASLVYICDKRKEITCNKKSKDAEV